MQIIICLRKTEIDLKLLQERKIIPNFAAENLLKLQSQGFPVYWIAGTDNLQQKLYCKYLITLLRWTVFYDESLGNPFGFLKPDEDTGEGCLMQF